MENDTQGLYHQQQLEQQEWLEVIANTQKLLEQFNEIFEVENERLSKIE